MKKFISVEEAYKNGQIVKGQYFYKQFKRKILKNSPFAKKLRYRTYTAYELYCFKGIDEDGRYDFDHVADIAEDRIMKITGSLSAGAKSVFDLNPLRNVNFK